MCNFASWIEKDGETEQIFFLTSKLIESAKGKELLADSSQDDLLGHGAIRRFFGLEQNEGANMECSDFSNPSNFPAVIVRAIKQGEMAGLPLPSGLLLKPLDAKYVADLKSLAAKNWDAKYWTYLKFLDAKYVAGLKSLDAKYWALFADPVNRTQAWREETVRSNG